MQGEGKGDESARSLLEAAWAGPTDEAVAPSGVYSLAGGEGPGSPRERFDGETPKPSRTKLSDQA